MRLQTAGGPARSMKAGTTPHTMTASTRRWAIAAAILLALIAAAWLALRALVPGDDELARRVEAAFEERMGERLVVGAVRWRVLGLPVVEVLDARTEQAEALQARRIAIYPQLMPLLRRQLVIDRLEVDGAVVPRNALAAFRGRTPQGDSAVALRALAFTNVTYIAYNGIPVVYDGEIVFDDDGLPRRARLLRPGVEPPASLDATREGRTDSGAHVYRLRLQAAGGSALGQARLATSAEGRMTLTGELPPRNVDVDALLEAFHRRSPIGGLASGETELRAQGDTWPDLFRSLHTRSVLRVERAKLQRFDLEKAIKSLGEDVAGETPLDSLTGVMETQNTAQGLKTVFTQVEAVAGSYEASGRATLYRRQIEAQGRLEMAGGVVDVPFAAQGPTRKPEFSIAWGTIAGAAVGTAVLPGIGTVLGAKIGGVVSGPPEPRPDPPRR